MKNWLSQKIQLSINKILTFLIISLILIVVSEGLYYFIVIHKKKFTKKPSLNFSENGKLNHSSTNTALKPAKEELNKHLKIAASTLNWLNKQKDDRGVYFFTQLYQPLEKKFKAEPSGDSGHYGLTSIWGQFKYLQATNDKDALIVLKNDLNTYTDRTKVMSIQNDFWNCKLMYELWQSDLFSQKEKEQIKKICWKSAYYYPQELYPIIEEKTTNDQKQAGIKKYFEDLELEKAINNQLFFETHLSNNDFNLILNFFPYPSDFAIRYLWKKDEKDLKIARYYFNKSIQLFTEKEELLGKKDLCLLGTASLDLYQVINKKSYLDFALFLGKKILEEKREIKPPVCAFFANQLYKVTGDKKFQEAKEKIVEAFISEALDLSLSKNNLTGEGGFLIDEKGNPAPVKNIRENGLLVGLLSQ